MKKTLSLILALLMTASCASTIFADEAIADDAEEAVEAVEEVVEAETEYDLAIEFLQNYGIYKGKEDGLLHAEDGVKRYEMALFTARVSTGWVDDSEWEDGIANDSKFDDLAGTAADKYLGAISFVDQKGIIEGYEDGTFKPEKGITYREALTMAVRTLEYQGLEWPWGYIQKAVTLGLTNGIEGVAYTDEINRGVTAQIIYNMMFAATKNGDTLAMRSFGIDFGWQNIIITANERAVYEAKGEITAQGVVAFKVLNNDGTLDNATYYVKGDYELGRVYSALFEINADEDYVTLLGACPYEAEVVENKGITDDEGVAYETPDKIGDYLSDYTLVDKYSSKILANKNQFNNEIIVVDGTKGTTYIEYNYKGTTPYAIDWNTGNILVKVWNDDKTAFEYEIAWWYNSTLDQYYRNVYLAEYLLDYKGNSNGKYGDDALTTDVIGIELMDEDDVADIKKAIEEAAKEEKTADGYKIIGKGDISKSAYALLEAYDLDGDGSADYAVYEGYQVGYLNANTDIDHDGHRKPAYELLQLTTNGKSGVGKYLVQDQCEHTDYADKRYMDTVTFAEGYEPSVDEDGKYINGYVIYGYNDTTGEIKIVKEIKNLGENDDVDTYVTTGVVRGYSLSNKAIIIDEEVLNYDYNELKGSAFVDANYVKDHKADYTKYVDRIFNQFVEYVVVDGKIVYIDTVGTTNRNYLVVDSYAGIDSDGYFVINGYSTNDLKYDQFRIGSYDGWKRGDFFHYADQITDEFTKGSVYQITSYDSEEDIYYVTCLSYFDNGKSVVKTSAETVTYTAKDNYRFKNGNVDGRMKDSDKYIIIGDAQGSDLGYYMPIYVYTGKIPTDRPERVAWTVTGQLIARYDDIHIIVNPTNIKGFSLDTYATGYVAVIERKITERNYNGYGQEYYLLGATEYTAEVFNLLTAKSDEVRVGTNIDIEAGWIYRTISETIIDDDLNVDKFTFDDFITAVDNIAYKDNNHTTADYLFKIFPVKESYLTGNDDAKRSLSSDVVSGLYWDGTSYNDLVSSLDVKVVELNDKGLVKSINGFSKDDFNDLKEDGVTEIKAFLVYNVADQKAVVYVLNYDCWKTVKEENFGETTNDYLLEVGPDAYIDVDGLVKETVVTTGAGSTYTYELTDIAFEYVGEAMTDTHEAIDEHGYHFGDEGYCTVEHYDVKIGVGATPAEADAKLDNYYGDFSIETLSSDCGLVSRVAFKLKDSIILTDKNIFIKVSFVAHEDDADGEYDASYDIYLLYSVDDGMVGLDFVSDAAIGNGLQGVWANACECHGEHEIDTYGNNKFVDNTLKA